MKAGTEEEKWNSPLSKSQIWQYAYPDGRRQIKSVSKVKLALQVKSLALPFRVKSLLTPMEKSY